MDVYLQSIHGVPILISQEDFSLLVGMRWYINAEGYAYTSTKIDGRWRSVLMHRLIMGLPLGDKRQIDHVNGNRLDNTRTNLRLCNTKQNQANRGKNSNNTSGYKGVRWDRVRGMWIATIGVDGRDIKLGAFFTSDEARRAYADASKKYHGEFSNCG